METEGREFHSQTSRNNPKIEKDCNKIRIVEILYQLLDSLIKMLMLLSEEQKQMSDLKPALHEIYFTIARGWQSVFLERAVP